MQQQIDSVLYKRQILSQISDPDNKIHEVDFKGMNPASTIESDNAFITIYELFLNRGALDPIHSYAVTIEHFVAPLDAVGISLDYQKHLEQEESIIAWDQRWSFFETEAEALQKSGEIYLQLLGVR